MLGRERRRREGETDMEVEKGEKTRRNGEMANRWIVGMEKRWINHRCMSKWELYRHEDKGGGERWRTREKRM